MGETKNHIRYALIECLLLGELFLAACDSANPTQLATPFVSSLITPATVSQMPASTPTPSPTYLSETTPTASSTVTPSPTIAYAMLTPSTPSSGLEAYRLVEWSPERADALITLLQLYPRAIDPSIFVGLDSMFALYQYAAYAQQEALLRFPTDPKAAKWRFGAAANLAVSKYGHGGQAYRDLILDALNRGEVLPNRQSLIKWFRTHPSPFSIQVTELTPPPGYLSSHLISISDNETGGTTVWVLKTPDGFSIHSLFDHMGDSYSTEYVVQAGDLTGDGMQEAVMYLGDHNGTFIGGQVVVADLSRVPPVRLSFGPEPAWLVDAGWTRGIELKTSQDTDTKRTHLTVTGVDSLYYYCDIYLNNRFAWNGQWLDLVDATVEFWGDNKQYSCIQLLEVSDFLSVVERKAILSFYERTFGDVKPAGMDRETGEDYPPDAQDRFRYLLAIYHGLLGDAPEAIAYLNTIVNEPSTPDSQWVKPAKEFLGTYKSVGDIYRVCAKAKVNCNPRRALEQSIRAIPADQYANIMPRLQELGAPILASGYFDFDDDHLSEQWFTIRHHSGKGIELWVVGQYEASLKAMYVTDTLTSEPDLHLYVTSDDILAAGATIFQVNGSDLFVFVHRKDTGEPFVTSFRRYFDNTLTEPQPDHTSPLEDLLAGADPEAVIGELHALEADPKFESSAEFYYSLGLAYELKDNKTEATHAYWQAMDKCCDAWTWPTNPSMVIAVTANPFAIMARAKLELYP